MKWRWRQSNTLLAGIVAQAELNKPTNRVVGAIGSPGRTRRGEHTDSDNDKQIFLVAFGVGRVGWNAGPNENLALILDIIKAFLN